MSRYQRDLRELFVLNSKMLGQQIPIKPFRPTKFDNPGTQPQNQLQADHADQAVEEEGEVALLMWFSPYASSSIRRARW